MEGKSLIMSALLVSLVLGQIQVEAESCAETTGEFCMLGCGTSVCGPITSLQKSCASEVVNEAVEKCNEACFDVCTYNFSGKKNAQYTSFTYNFTGDQPTELLYQGDAHFPSDSTFLRMTNTTAAGSADVYGVGRVVYPTPVTFWEAGAQVDFETTVNFRITPNPGDTNPADGFTFFIAAVDLPLGYTGGSYGIFDISGAGPSVFAVEFDIFSNPGVDPDYSHIAIDIESNVSKNMTNVGGALLGQQVTAFIGYEEATKLIRVRINAGIEIYEVSYVFDLSAILPQQVQVGISAGTGGQVAVHDLISWSFTSTLVHAHAAAGQYV